MLISLKRIIKAGRIGFSRNGSQNTAMVFILVITVSFVTLLFLLNLSFQSLLADLQEKVDISVYFREEILEEDILEVKSELSKIPEVKNVEYVSREKALERFIERHRTDLVLMSSLDYVGENPFLASLNIQACQASQYEAISSFLETASFQPFIDKVDYYQRKPVIERISSIASGVNKIGVASGLFLAVLAVLVVFNTIRLAIYNSRKEISVMRLVGACNSFIQGPFLVQGAIAGSLAVLITVLVFSGACYFLSPKLEALFSGFNIWNYFIGNFWIILLIQVFTGIGLGVISSLIATKKYLKV